MLYSLQVSLRVVPNTLQQRSEPVFARQSSTRQQLQQQPSRKDIGGSHAPGPDSFLGKRFALLEAIHDMELGVLVVSSACESLKGLLFV